MQNKLAPEFTFAGFTWPRYVADMACGAQELRKKAQSRKYTGGYYHAPKPTDTEKGFYHESVGMPGLRWQWCDDVASSIHHEGWFCDRHGDGDKIRGLVFRLPKNRGFVMAWSMGESMASAVDYSQIFDDETDCAHAANSWAESVAYDMCKEYDGEDLREGSDAIDCAENAHYRYSYNVSICPASTLLRAAFEAIEKRRGATSD